MGILEKFLKPSLMKSAESEKSSGGSTPPLKDGEILLFTDGKTEFLQKGDVFKNLEGGSAVVEGISGKNGETNIHYTEYSPDQIILHDKQILIKPMKNFQVAVGVKEMESVDQKERAEKINREKEAELAFRVAYVEMKHLAEAFAREFDATMKGIDKWYESLVKEDVRYDQWYEKIKEIADEWNSLGINFLENGKKRKQLFDRLRLLEEEMDVRFKDDVIQSRDGYDGENYLQAVDVVEKSSVSIKDDEDALDEEGDQNRGGFIKTKKNVRSEQSDDEKKGENKAFRDRRAMKNAFVAAKIVSSKKKNKHSKETSLAWETIGTETPTIPVERNEKELGEQNVLAGSVSVVSETQTEQKKLMSEEEIEEAVNDFGWLLEDKARPVFEKIKNLPLDVMPKSVGLYVVVGGNKIFLLKDDTNGLLAAYEGLPSEAQVAAEKKWLDINHDLESEYLGRIFLIALEQTKNYWIKKISSVTSLKDLNDMGRVFEMNKKTGSAGQQREWKIFIEEREELLFKDESEGGKPLKKVLMTAREQRKRVSGDSEHGSFKSIFREQLCPILRAANKEIFSLWNSKQRELSGRGKKERKSRETRIIEGEQSSFELVIPEEKQKKILDEMRGFIMKGLEYIDEALKKKEARGLDDFLRSTDPDDRKRVQLLLQNGIGENVVKIGQAYGLEIKTGVAKSIAGVIEEKGKALLLDAMTQRLLLDKTKQE